MNDQEIIDILKRFEDFLSVGDIVTDVLRKAGWLLVKGLSILVDGMQNVVDTVLLTKQFFQNPEVLSFIASIRPLLWILLAISLIISGYMLIFQRKLSAETIGINLIVSISVLVLLTSGMEKVNDFTDEAIKTINNGPLYNVDSGTVSENILSRNITDLVEFDKNGWSNPEKIQSLPVDVVRNIKITEKLDPENENLKLKNSEVAKHYLTVVDGKVTLEELSQGGLASWNDEYYYRFSVDWLTILITLSVMGFTLFSIAYKLARLSFELVFNQLLATIIAPVDIHDGQKTKKILQNMLNIFIVVILIFLSMKLYVIGAAWLENNLDGWAYLIALIGFSVAVIDGPNIVERIFGIDIGLKNAWGLAVGAYTAGKFVSGLAKMGAGRGKSGSSIESTAIEEPKFNARQKEQKGDTDGRDRSQSPLSRLQPKSPFDESANNAIPGNSTAFTSAIKGQNGISAKTTNSGVSPINTGQESINPTNRNNQGHVSTVNPPFDEVSSGGQTENTTGRIGGVSRLYSNSRMETEQQNQNSLISTHSSSNVSSNSLVRSENTSSNTAVQSSLIQSENISSNTVQSNSIQSNDISSQQNTRTDQSKINQSIFKSDERHYVINDKSTEERLMRMKKREKVKL